MESLVRTELICVEIWGDRVIHTRLPLLDVGDSIFLDFTIKDLSAILGTFEIKDRFHILDGTGYTQRLKISPESGHEP